MSAMRRAPLAMACIAACVCARAASVDPHLMRESAALDALIVFERAPSFAPPLAPPLAPDAGYRARRRVLVDNLRAHAEETQRATRAWLDAHGIAYRSYWITNAIEARLSPSALDALAHRSDIARIVSNATIANALPRPEPPASTAPSGDPVAWGVAQIGAPDIWTAGYTGQGVVVAGEDSGYRWDHPALKPQYRGWNGTIAAHDHNWHDAIHDAAGNPCGNDAQAPCDDAGHGTHTAGSFAGDDGADHRIGVAPGAKWIGCRNMDRGNGTPARYIECMQWMLAPTDLAGANADPDLAPDVINNSWSCPASEGCTAGDELADAVDQLVAGGIFFAAAAGNGGNDCGGIGDAPAIYDASFVVGATDDHDALASFSLRGPVDGVTTMRPDLSAPGVGIVSSWNDGGYREDSGTSMATPHVVGTVALMLSVAPALKGQPARIAGILRATARTEGVTDPVTQTCGGTGASTWPNYMIGYGRLDAYAAALVAQATGDPSSTFRDGFDGLVAP